MSFSKLNFFLSTVELNVSCYKDAVHRHCRSFDTSQASLKPFRLLIILKKYPKIMRKDLIYKTFSGKYKTFHVNA
jgi:hypothetical protein